ncbi:hypothetical protein D3C80_1312080 [compost metagenome]
MILRGCAWMSRKRIASCALGVARWLWSRPVNSDNAAQALTATWPLVSGARLRMTSAASMADSIFGRPWLTPSSRTVWFSSPRNATSCSVFQLMPLPPLPSLSSSGPREVNFL